MNSITKYILALVFLFNTAIAFSQNMSDQEWEILKLMDNRSFGNDDKIKDYLHSIDPVIRQKAIYALANIGDSNTVSYIDFLFAGPFKDYPDKNDLKACAFMLGQINCRESRKMLGTILNNEADFKTEMAESGSYIIDAVGKTGDENMLNELLLRNDLLYSSDANITRAIAMAIARFALRKIKNEKSVEVLKYYANNSEDTVTIENTAYAFWRTGEKSLLSNAHKEIYSLAESKDPQTRMWAFNALGKLQDKTLLMYTLESFDSEPDWRVKVNMLNSLNNYSLNSIPDLSMFLFSVIGDAVMNENESVSLTAITVLRNIFQDIRSSENQIATSIAGGLKDNLVFAINSTEKLTSPQRSEIANSLSLIYRDEVKSELLNAFSGTDDYDLKSGIIKAFGNFKNPEVYKEIRDTVSSEVRRFNEKNPNTSGEMITGNELAKLFRGFVQMLSDLDDIASSEDRNIMRLIFTEFAGSKDPLISDICLTSLKDSIYKDYRNETAAVILFDYEELRYPEDAAVILIFIDAMKDLYNDSTIKVLERNLNFGNYDIAKASSDALEKITWKKYGLNLTPWKDHDRSYFENIIKKKYVSIKTGKGNIGIELLPEAAPFTVLNFLKLVESDFYDGTVLHRVVPNFVIQGGDPTGTGYGSPGYSIRSEFSPLEFKTGMVGMASSGNDTEGSQFFITHSATPHLDGKYSIFGNVIKGMEVVDKIQAGDKIDDVEIVFQ